MPLDEFMTSMGDIHKIDLARDVAAANCMKAIGFTDWEVGSLRTWGPRSYIESDLFDYLDPIEASLSGYPTEAVDPKLEAIVSTRPKHVPTNEEMLAHDGRVTATKSGKKVPAGGCAGEADRRLFAKDRKLPADPRNLAVDARSAALRDSRVVQAMEAWKACAQKAGLTYNTPFDAEHDQRWMARRAGEPATEEEKRVAALDAKCQAEVNMVGVYKAVRAAYETRFIKDNKAKLEASAAIFNAWVKKAEEINSAGA